MMVLCQTTLVVLTLYCDLTHMSNLQRVKMEKVKLAVSFSIVFHLLQIIGRLLHFYERHMNEVGYKEIYIDVKNRLSEIVKEETILNTIINYGLFYAYKFLSDGKKVAKELLDESYEKITLVK